MERDAKDHRHVRLDRPLVLVGLMGVGKSTVGRRLAARLGLPFVDADSEIERAADMSIAEIFERYGEPYFRDGERRVIARLIDGSQEPRFSHGSSLATGIEASRRVSAVLIS